jgi:hypothetical protein
MEEGVEFMVGKAERISRFE